MYLISSNSVQIHNAQIQYINTYLEDKQTIFVFQVHVQMTRLVALMHSIRLAPSKQLGY